MVSYSPPLTYNQVINYPKTPMVDDVEFVFFTNLVQPEPGKLMTFVHVDVYYWSPTVWRRMKEMWTAHRHTLPPIVYASGDIPDRKWRKFVESLGFKPLLEDCRCTDGESRPIYVHFAPLQRNPPSG